MSKLSLNDAHLLTQVHFSFDNVLVRHDAGTMFEFLGPLPDYIKDKVLRNHFDRIMTDVFYNELHYYNQDLWLDDKTTGAKTDIEHYPPVLAWGNESEFIERNTVASLGNVTDDLSTSPQPHYSLIYQRG